MNGPSLIYFLLVSLSVFNSAVLGQVNLSEMIEEKIDEQYGAAVLVAEEGKIFFEEYFGYTDASMAHPITAHTLFQIGSVGKSFTAIAILQLMEKNRINLDDPISKYLDDVPKKKAGITIKHLFQHTSGLTQTYVTDDVVDREEAVRRVLNDRTRFSPGTEFAYSNSNYALLAAILEKVTGQNYEAYVSQHIYEPSSLSGSNFWGMVNALNQSEVAQMRSELPEITRSRNWGYVGSGNIYSTVGDLRKFFDGVFNHQLISNSTFDLIYDDPFMIREGLSMGLGWFQTIHADGSIENWSRGSNDWGHNAVIRYFPDKDQLIIITTNSGEMGSPTATGNRILGDLVVEHLK